MDGIKNILFITLTNIGDAVLTLPVLDAVRRSYPGAEVSVLTALRPSDIFSQDPSIKKVYVYDKHGSLRLKAALVGAILKERFDLVVDLRNSLLGAVLACRYKTSAFLRIPSSIRHMSQRHLFRLRGIPGIDASKRAPRSCLYISSRDREYVSGLLGNKAPGQGKLFVIAAGARSQIKRWPRERFAGLAGMLGKEYGARIVLIGDEDDAETSRYIAAVAAYPLLDLTGKTTLSQAAALLEQADLLVTNDSANLHIASYLGTPVVAVFGPTDDEAYGPWSSRSRVAKKEIFCRPCRKAQCRFATLACMTAVTVQDVLAQIRDVLRPSLKPFAPDRYKRILVIRTDRIGDVLLSTPVLAALREACPSAYLAAMIRPYTRDILIGNPFLDEIVYFDKDAMAGNPLAFAGFILQLRRKKFDLALVLYPSQRTNLIPWLAGIPVRVGFGHKGGFLLTHPVSHEKHLGEKHEIEYNLGLLEAINIFPSGHGMYMPIRAESEQWAQDFLSRNRISAEEKLLIIHPGASCPSKIWPAQRYAAVADTLVRRYGFKVIIMSGREPLDIKTAQDVAAGMSSGAVTVLGTAPISETASLLKRATLFISSDTGPMHVAAALSVPQVAIFGRNQPGLSPKRWGPLSAFSRVLHKDVGCGVCLAHNCKRGFACLEAVSVEETVEACAQIIQKKPAKIS